MLLQAVLAALGRCMPGLVLARIGKATYRCVERAVAQAVVLVQAVDAALGRSLLALLLPDLVKDLKNACTTTSAYVFSDWVC